MDKIKYFRRRQFILGPENINYEGWKKYTIAGRCYLSTHPDLTVLQVSHEKKSLTLLGYFIDPYQYEQSQEDIVNEYVREERGQGKTSDTANDAQWIADIDTGD